MKHTILMFRKLFATSSPHLFLQEGEGEDYIAANKMQKSGMWAMETDVLATAKMLHKDVYTWYKGQWLCYSYYCESTTDAIYLDNTSEYHLCCFTSLIFKLYTKTYVQTTKFVNYL